MTEAEALAFNQGYLTACCNIFNLHGEDCVAADVLAEAGISQAEVTAHYDLTDYDQKALDKIRKARSDDPLT